MRPPRGGGCGITASRPFFRVFTFSRPFFRDFTVSRPFFPVFTVHGRFSRFHGSRPTNSHLTNHDVLISISRSFTVIIFIRIRFGSKKWCINTIFQAESSMYIANQFSQKMSERGVGVVKPNNPEIIVSQELSMFYRQKNKKQTKSRQLLPHDTV